MGELKNLKADFCSTSDDDDENIEGAYKDLGYLLPIMEVSVYPRGSSPPGNLGRG